MKKFLKLLVIIGTLLILSPLIYGAFMAHWIMGLFVVGFIMFCIGGLLMSDE